MKNSLTERAADKAGAEALKSVLQGPTALTFVRGDAAAAAKALSDAQRVTEVLAFKGGLMDGQVVSADEIRAIAKLPSRDVLYAQLVGTVAAPLNGLARTLNALISGVAVQLGQIRDQGLVGGTAAPARGRGEPLPARRPAEAEAPAEEAPATAEEPPRRRPSRRGARGCTDDTDSTDENQTDAAAEADDASDAKED